MKKISAFILSIIMTASAAFAANNILFDDDKPIDYSELPADAKAFIEKYFAKEQASHIILDKEIMGNEYKVVFASGVKLEFDSNGEWTEVSCRYSEVPNSLVPDKIQNYIANNYPEKKITEIKRKHGNWEAKITGGLELTFDRSYRLVEIDD